jgi:two-component system nitrogen regulation response regulator GlnG
VVHIRVPALSERRSDIPELIEYFLKRARSGGKEIEGITDDAVELLQSLPWQGNVRELQNAIERASVLCAGMVLRPEDFSFLSANAKPSGEAGSDEMKALADRLIERAREEKGLELLPQMEKILIERALEEVGGNQVQAAKLLGVSRNTLRNRIERFGLGRDEDGD